MVETRLSGKVAIVTGAGKGIGRGIAVGFAEAGADVVCAARTGSDIEEAAAEVRALEGKRLLLRRTTGFDLHSVREYEQGESLRRVHWPSTAKRAQLMVKELEDAPRDEVAVVLDADASAVVG